MRVLVTGAAGFVGRYLTAELQRHDHEPVGFDAAPPDSLDVSFPYFCGDITDPDSLRTCIERTQPDACVHLAGIAFVPLGWSDPQKVMHVNVTGTLNVLEALRATAPQARVLVITSSEVYGRDPRPEPVREEETLTPSNLYGVSKVAADMACRLYFKQYGQPVMTARPQNHIGPGQSRLFATSAFAEQLIELRGKTDPVMNVGNLDSERDFTDVRDVVRAYRLLVESGQPGEAYNIASGQTVSIREILNRLCDHAGIQPTLEVDEGLFRPTDKPPLLAIDKIQRDVGWTPTISLSDTLDEIYDHLAAKQPH